MASTTKSKKTAARPKSRATTKTTRSGAKGLVSKKLAPLTIIEAQLNTYAERGVFRSFSRTAFERGIAEFRFFWLLNLPFQMSFDTKRNVIIFNKILTNIEPGSALETELKAFLAECASADRPEHRRVDPRLIGATYANRAKAVTLTLKSLDFDWEHATRKAIQLINEIFLTFLNARHPEYMIATFNLPDE